MAKYLFKDNQRLKTNDQFRKVLSHKCCDGNRLFRLYVAKNDCQYPRLGVSVSKRCGNSVVRNRLKRLSREVFRTEQHNITSGYDYLLIFSRKMSKKGKGDLISPIKRISFSQLREFFVAFAGSAVGKSRSRGKIGENKTV